VDPVPHSFDALCLQLLNLYRRAGEFDDGGGLLASLDRSNPLPVHEVCQGDVLLLGPAGYGVVAREQLGIP